MIEKHPFGNFVPKKANYLMLGSFVTKPQKPYEWFYANGRNQFWPIIEQVYGSEFRTKEQQQRLFTQLEMALADIILSCERRKNSNLDTNLFNITFNTKAIKQIINQNTIKKIFFTSRYVETLFRKQFKEIIDQYPKIELITLPSPSPRYALIPKEEKIKRYKILLPKLSKPWFVYTLQCSDGSYYTGITNDLKKRFKAHIEGNGARYTKSHKPIKIIYTEKYATKSEALKREAEIKSWPKKRKEAIIARSAEN